MPFKPSQYSNQMARLRFKQACDASIAAEDALTSPDAPEVPPWALDMVARGSENIFQASNYLTFQAYGATDDRASQISNAYPAAAPIADAIVALADKLGIDPAWLANVMNFESGFNPKARNPGSDASGLIQFIPPTAARLGVTTTTIRSMSALQQMSLVERYFAPYKGRMRSQEDVYMVVFYPKAIGNPDYRFPASVTKGNPGIYTPRDYANKANQRAKIASVIGWEAERVASAGDRVLATVASDTGAIVQQRRWLIAGIGIAGIAAIVGISAYKTRVATRKPALRGAP